MARAGFDVVAQWEECDAGKKTFDRNVKYFGKIDRPIGHGNWNMLDVPHVHLLYANPPCAVWSSANVSAGPNADRLADPRLKMTGRTMETALALGPDVLVLESVVGAFKKGGAYYSDWAERFIAAGYGVTFLLTDAILHGLASERQRFHFIAHKCALPLREPDMRRFMPRTVRMAIGDISDKFDAAWQHEPHGINAGLVEIISKTPPGGKLRDTALAMMAEGWPRPQSVPSFLERRLYWDSPSLVVMGMEMKAHPERNRYVTVREGLRLMSYPDDFYAGEDKTTDDGPVQAVMPLMGEWLARAAADSVKCGQPARRDLEVVDWLDLARPYRQTAVLKGLEEL